VTTNPIEQTEMLQGEVRGKLSALRVALSTRLLLEGLAWTVAALVALVFATMAFDYFLRLERPLRIAIASLAAAGVLIVVWRQLIVPLRVPMLAPDLALLVEHRFGQLGDRLISAIEFSGRSDAAALGLSAAMMRRVAAEANELARPLPFKEIVERRGVFRSWSVAGCALGLLIGFGFWQGDLLGLWFQRDVLFRDTPWPQETYLTVRGEPGDFTVLRGDDLTVLVEVEPRSTFVPPHVTLHARYATIGRTEETVEPAPEDPRRFVKVFPAVSEEFDFYVTGGDDHRDKAEPHRVRLIDPPAFRKLEFLVRSPNYMDRGDVERFGAGTGALGVPLGAEVTVRGEANKELASAEIVLDEKPIGRMRPETARRGDTVEVLPLRYVGAFEITGENRPATRTLRFALTDTAGHSNRRRGAKYMIQVQPDHRPTLDVRKQGIGGQISPRAVLPLDVRVKDDHGIAAVNVLVRRSTRLKDANSYALELPPDTQRELERRHELDIEPLKLAPGLTIQVAAQATDTLPATFGGPNVGDSSTLTFRVVKPEELMEQFVRRQKEIRLEFVQALALQESARAKTEAAMGIFAGGRVDAEGRRLMQSSAGIQRNVGAEVAKATDSLGQIVEEMKNNRIGTKTEREQISGGIVKPLERLAEPIRQIAAALDKTKSVDVAGELADQARDIEGLQGEVFRQMDEILQHMAKLESKQELANKLRLIIDWSEQLFESIKKKQEAEVKTIFDGTTQPARP